MRDNDGRSLRDRTEELLDARYVEGYNDALKGEQLVYADDLDAPMCRIVYHVEPGDDTVGMQGWSGWVLAEDQSGTDNNASELREALEELVKWYTCNDPPGCIYGPAHPIYKARRALGEPV